MNIFLFSVKNINDNRNSSIIEFSLEGSECIVEKEIKGIMCEVKSCKYHDASNNCHAGQIKVGNQTAKSMTDTACETFECCDSCKCE